MEADFRQDPAVDPAFFYTLGDCVYFNGDGKEYLPQFYLPYEHYEAPIVAVAGNHDGDPSPGTTSLDAFMRNFCAPKPQVTADAGDQSRDAMTQPNVFWTFVTPLCTIIGLYSNVPEHGVVHPDQQKWLLGELKGASPKMPVFVTLHHPPLSADDHHGGSGQMKQLLDQCFRDADRVPEMVLAGHVHNYQRFTRTDSKGKQTPYIVAGAGGYHNLHYVAKVNGVKPRTPITIDVEGENVTLEHFVDDRHGFLRLEVTADLITGIYYTVPRPHEPFSSPPTKADAFKLDWKSRRLL
jgi:hypothetical protein